MRTNFKVVLLAISLAMTSLEVFAVDRQYREDYDLRAASMNKAVNESNISFYRNNQIIVMKPDPKGKSTKPVPFTCNIKENGDLTKPKLSKELNKLGIEGSGVVAYDSVYQMLYFAKYDKVDKDYALYQSEALKGKWQEPTKMKIEGVGTERAKENYMLVAGWNYREIGLSGFRNPSVAKGGNRIYFTARIRQREYNNVGSTDIYYIDRNSDGTWSRPVNCGNGVNSQGREDYAFCVGDSVLYYSTTSKGYGVQLMKSYFVNGQWTKGEDMGKPFNSNFIDKNLIADDKHIFLVSNRNPKGRDDVYLFRKKPDPAIIPPVIPIPPEPEPDPMVQFKKEWNFVLFYFDFDIDHLSEEFIVQFNELVSEMKQFPNETFEVTGHTDERGSDRYNQKLSERRANFVRDLLIKEGFPPEKLLTKGFGEKALVVEHAKTEDEHQQNRRVEVRIYQEPLPTPVSNSVPTDQNNVEPNAEESAK
jgi:outer membrane protein OmpA-like peptidoglycan-associated protein